jgi:hypothetical protein
MHPDSIYALIIGTLWRFEVFRKRILLIREIAISFFILLPIFPNACTPAIVGVC